jgi:hypothetical protein
LFRFDWRKMYSCTPWDVFAYSRLKTTALEYTVFQIQGYKTDYVFRKRSYISFTVFLDSGFLYVTLPLEVRTRSGQKFPSFLLSYVRVRISLKPMLVIHSCIVLCILKSESISAFCSSLICFPWSSNNKRVYRLHILEKTFLLPPSYKQMDRANKSASRSIW